MVQPTPMCTGPVQPPGKPVLPGQQPLVSSWGLHAAGLHHCPSRLIHPLCQWRLVRSQDESGLGPKGWWDQATWGPMGALNKPSLGCWLTGTFTALQESAMPLPFTADLSRRRGAFFQLRMLGAANRTQLSPCSATGVWLQSRAKEKRKTNQGNSLDYPQLSKDNFLA
jgi:hypothetical protein